MRMRPQILCIIGDSRSGSTLLQYLLATQPGVAAVGELRRLAQLVREGRPCSCGHALHECPRWGPILARLDLRPRPRPRVSKRAGEAAGLLAGVPLGRAPARRAAPAAARAADQAATVYRLLGEQERCRVIVDSSKDPGHALELALNGEITVHPLYLFRDGRAVVHSKVRRTNIDPDVAIRHWRRLTTGMLWLRRLRAGTTVHYEDLCADPRAVLEPVLAPLGIAVHLQDPPAPVTELHSLGGSPGFGVQSVERLHPDASWRSEAPAELLRAFDSAAGDLNRRLGY